MDVILIIMTQHLAGIVVSSLEADVVILKKDADVFTLERHITLRLQTGSRCKAYRVIYDQLSSALTEATVACACVQGSALNRMGTTMAHLESAELRGVVLAAAATACEVNVINKAVVSRTFGDRKVDDYVKDNSFWVGHGLDKIPKGMRGAAFVVLAKFLES